MLNFEINPDISQASTISAEFYTNERFFEESKEKIFAKTWQFVGKTAEMQTLKPIVLLENFLDEPLVLSKNEAEVRCFSNVCTHRGAILVEKECQAKGIRCRYHGRRFGLDGKFLSMPEFEEAKNFPSEKDNLPKVSLTNWHDFLFVSLNPLAKHEEFFKEVSQKVTDFENFRLHSTKDYLVNAHWALYCENYLEGFHVPFVHQSLNAVIDYETYTTETFRYSSLQTAFDDEGNVAALYFFVFPNMMFNFYPWGLSLNIVKPLSPKETKVSYFTYISNEDEYGKGAGGDLETVELEDQEIVESVQRGIRSRFYDSGRYSPKREQGTHHFHRLLAEFLD